MPSEITSNELALDLKKPCADCPFRKSVPCHDGVAGDLIVMTEKIERGEFVHSCHKTDSRSDGFTEGYTGPIQHCAGALIMMKNEGPEAIQNFWLLPSRWKKIKALKKEPDVFGGRKEMLFKYVLHYGKPRIFGIV